MTYPWERTDKEQAARIRQWPPIRPGDGPVQYAQRRIAWYLEATGKRLDELSTTELMACVGLAPDIWQTDKPRGKRKG